MLSEQDNDILCRVGPGTPMGNLMREYWIPALMSDELDSPDGPPMRLRLLGENLIAFRATSGSAGIVANACPHRGASMFFGRNEEDGLRCVYHGWKFATDGTCIDMPSEPAESNFKSKVKARAYPTIERGNVIWTYMGTRETPPPLPDLEGNMQGEESRVVKTLTDCNYMQRLEGDIDTVHAGFLHYGHVMPEDCVEGTLRYYFVSDRAPRSVVANTEYGVIYGAYRDAVEEGMYSWRIANFLFPFYTQTAASGPLGEARTVIANVPIDDKHVMRWNMSAPMIPSATEGGFYGKAYNSNNPFTNDLQSLTRNRVRSRGAYAGPLSSAAERLSPSAERAAAASQLLPDTSDWIGTWREVGSRDNDYLLDREEQATKKTYTGIPTINLQDRAVCESMGPIYDRSHEHLATTDSMIIRTRRALINAAKAYRDQRTVPPCVDNPEVYRQRTGAVILPKSADWLEATKELRKGFIEHTPEGIKALIPAG